ncbi:helix-turn-helix domain-containing protein [Microbacterium sp. A93]|uniref:helix-turn-helix domain-containing protein n=1 Tax=Microbacterium sp. A93 TaxID=3450716 RepID=UPI003F429819
MVNKEQQRHLMGAYIRQQRRIADLSMRQVSAMVGISNPYLSQIERGLRAPSEAVAAGIATALGVGVDDLYEKEPGRPGSADSGAQGSATAGSAAADPVPGGPDQPDVLSAIHGAQELSPEQRTSLAEIYRSFVRSNQSDQPG